MSTRRSRLNLSLVRRSESPRSPIGDRTRSSISESDVRTESDCSTPMNTRKRSSTFSDGSPVSYECDYSPMVPMSQDTSNVISGVSWAWNSPKRSIAKDHKQRPRPLKNSNIISSKDPEFSRSYRKKAADRLTGFYKFQSELKQLQSETSGSDLEKTDSCSSVIVVPSSSPAPSNDGENLFVSFSRATNKEDNSRRKSRKSEKSLFLKSDVQSDSFNDSDLDSLLLQASQVVEKKAHAVTTLASGKKHTPAAVPPEKQPEKRRSFFKSRTTDDFGSISDELFNDSDFDSFLVEASQMIEKAATHGPKTGEETKKSPNVSSKKVGLLTRHKSMPESPSQKENHPGSSRRNPPKWPAKRINPQSSISVSSSTSGDSMQTILSHSSSLPAQNSDRKCTKEEIEKKRQEALKRQQANRMKRLMGNQISTDKKNELN